MALPVSPYNLTELSDVTGIYDLVVFANNSTSELLMGLFVMAIFVIALFVLKQYEFDFALLSSSFGAFVISSMLAFIGLLNILYPLAFLAILAFTAFYVFVIKN